MVAFTYFILRVWAALENVVEQLLMRLELCSCM